MIVGILGLGKMGMRIATKLSHDGHSVVGWNRTKSVTEGVQFATTETIQDLIKHLDPPRIIWMMLPAGEATESVFQEVVQYGEEGDIVVDGGNAFYKDTERRSQELRAKGIGFLGIGVSGGVKAFDTGYPLMVGGDQSSYHHMRPILESLSKPQGGYEYFGEDGAGHFVKMVHNAIEYSYMQGIGEGFGVLEKAPYQFDLAKVARLYTKNTLVSGFMMDRTVEVLEKDPKLEELTGVIGKASGETVWTVEEAKKMDVPIENIEQALEFRNRSQTDEKIQTSFAARMVSSLRHAFGGHEVKKK